MKLTYAFYYVLCPDYTDLPVNEQ